MLFRSWELHGPPRDSHSPTYRVLRAVCLTLMHPIQSTFLPKQPLVRTANEHHLTERERENEMPDEQTLFACLRRGAAAKRVADSSLRDPPFVVSPEQFGEVVTCFGPIQGTPTNPLSILDRVCVPLYECYIPCCNQPISFRRRRCRSTLWPRNHTFMARSTVPRLSSCSRSKQWAPSSYEPHQPGLLSAHISLPPCTLVVDSQQHYGAGLLHHQQGQPTRQPQPPTHRIRSRHSSLHHPPW